MWRKKPATSPARISSPEAGGLLSLSRSFLMPELCIKEPGVNLGRQSFHHHCTTHLCESCSLINCSDDQASWRKSWHPLSALLSLNRQLWKSRWESFLLGLRANSRPNGPFADVPTCNTL